MPVQQFIKDNELQINVKFMRKLSRRAIWAKQFNTVGLVQFSFVQPRWLATFKTATPEAEIKMSEKQNWHVNRIR